LSTFSTGTISFHVKDRFYDFKNHSRNLNSSA
jgi:hypothetical protein